MNQSTIINMGVSLLPQNQISIRHALGQGFYSYEETDKGIILTPSKALMELTTSHASMSDLIVWLNNRWN